MLLRFSEVSPLRGSPGEWLLCLCFLLLRFPVLGRGCFEDVVVEVEDFPQVLSLSSVTVDV
jgi:hypothetical protein